MADELKDPKVQVEMDAWQLTKAIESMIDRSDEELTPVQHELKNASRKLHLRLLGLRASI